MSIPWWLIGLIWGIALALAVLARWYQVSKRDHPLEEHLGYEPANSVPVEKPIDPAERDLAIDRGEFPSMRK